MLNLKVRCTGLEGSNRYHSGLTDTWWNCVVSLNYVSSWGRIDCDVIRCSSVDCSTNYLERESTTVSKIRSHDHSIAMVNFEVLQRAELRVDSEVRCTIYARLILDEGVRKQQVEVAALAAEGADLKRVHNLVRRVEGPSKGHACSDCDRVRAYARTRVIEMQGLIACGCQISTVYANCKTIQIVVEKAISRSGLENNISGVQRRSCWIVYELKRARCIFNVFMDADAVLLRQTR